MYTDAQEKILTNILYIAMFCIDYEPESRPNISDIREYIKFSNDSSFKLPCSKSKGQTGDSNPLLSLTMESQAALTTETVIGQIENENLR